MNREIPAPEEAKEMLSYIEARPDYDKWIRIISAVGNTYDFNTALEILLSRFRDETPKEHEIKLKHRLKNISIATLIHYAKENGYRKAFNIVKNDNVNSFRLIKVTKNNDDQRGFKFFNLNRNFFYRFDDETEERLAIMVYQQGLSRLKAESLVINETPDIKRERAFRVAINEKVRNKTTDFKKLNSNFVNMVLTAREIADEIGRGFSFMPGEFRENEKGYVIRKNSEWLCSELVVLDIDNGLKLDEALSIKETEKALLLYTTPSHTKENHRFRIIFDLPYIETNQERFNEIVKSFIKIYRADEQCKDLARLFYGNSEATIYLIRTDEILHYKNGVCQNERTA